MSPRASDRLAQARGALHELLARFEAEGVHAKLDAVRELVGQADAEVDGPRGAAQRLVEIRERYDLMRFHQDGLDDVYFPRADRGEQVRVNRELDAVRTAFLQATEPDGRPGRRRP